jgi:hypothetical protein
MKDDGTLEYFSESTAAQTLDSLVTALQDLLTLV